MWICVFVSSSSVNLWLNSYLKSVSRLFYFPNKRSRTFWLGFHAKMEQSKNEKKRTNNNYLIEQQIVIVQQWHTITITINIYESYYTFPFPSGHQKFSRILSPFLFSLEKLFSNWFSSYFFSFVFSSIRLFF